MRVNVKLAVIMGTEADFVVEPSSDWPSPAVGRGPAMPRVSVRDTLVVDVDPIGIVKVTTVWLATSDVGCAFGYGSADATGSGSVASPVQIVEEEGPRERVMRCVVVNQPIPCGDPVPEVPLGPVVSTEGEVS